MEQQIFQNASSVPDFRRSDKGNILHYCVEDRLEDHTPVYSYTESPELGHGRIETRTYRVYDGLEVIADILTDKAGFRLVPQNQEL